MTIRVGINWMRGLMNVDASVKMKVRRTLDFRITVAPFVKIKTEKKFTHITDLLCRIPRVNTWVYFPCEYYAHMNIGLTFSNEERFSEAHAGCFLSVGLN